MSDPNPSLSDHSNPSMSDSNPSMSDSNPSMSDSKPKFALVITNPSGGNWRDEYVEFTAAEQAVLNTDIAARATYIAEYDACQSRQTVFHSITVTRPRYSTIQEDAVESGKWGNKIRIKIGESRAGVYDVGGTRKDTRMNETY